MIDTTALASLLEQYISEKMVPCEDNIVTCSRPIRCELVRFAADKGFDRPQRDHLCQILNMRRENLVKAVYQLNLPTWAYGDYCERHGLPCTADRVWFQGLVFPGARGILEPCSLNVELSPFANYIQRDCLKGDKMSIPANVGQDWFNSFLGFRGWKWQTAKTIDAMAAAEGYPKYKARMRSGSLLPMYRGFDLDCAHYEALAAAGLPFCQLT
jgi:hypothetical protein